ncbi:MAG TPA: CDC48 family AAA ATPase [Candidatus Woesearchaeota archaeon]|nr:CDC48 family AAA ATPase [Candidatus Woesearchaeota archaeon]
MVEDKNQNNEDSIKLKVAEAMLEDVSKGIVRIDSNYMKEIGARPGDIVTIEGKKKTVGIVARCYPGDIGLNILRMDGSTRRNADATLGELVIVSKADVVEAKKIVIAPIQKGIMIKASDNIFKRGLMGRAMVKGDVVSMGGSSIRKQTLSQNPFYEDVFKMLDETNVLGFGLSGLKFLVVSTNPKDKPVIVTELTEVEYNPEPIEILDDSKIVGVTYENIGGLDEEIRKIREMVELPLKHPEIFDRLGIEPPKGVLLYGPPGTGKTLLARAVANETNSFFSVINGPEIMSKYYGQSEQNLRKIFDEAEKNAPSIIFIDEIDAIVPKREETKGEVERRVVAQLLALLDGLKSRGKVVVIAATNIPNAIDEALRRPGRFDREISLGVPGKEARLQILKIHTLNMPLEEVNLEMLSSITHGFVGADLAALSKEAAMNAIRRILPDMDLDKSEALTPEALEKIKITMDDFRDSLKVVRPSALREFLIELPNVRWGDIGGLELAKQELKEAVEWPLKNPEKFTKFGIRPPKGILLFGPPGTGKTMVAKAVAKESEANFLLVKGPEMLSKWVGESEKAIREIFKKARQSAPSIVFFDEIDSIAPKRGVSGDSGVTERVVNQLLTEMDGIEVLTDVVVIAATNRLDMLDSALIRPGRFDRVILTLPPEKSARLEIFKVHTKNMPLKKDVDLKDLASKTEGYVGADIESVCREAAMLTLRNDLDAKDVGMQSFEEALKKVKPSVTKEIIEAYEKLNSTFRSTRAEELKNKPSYYG